jgi:hypothetical protein
VERPVDGGVIEKGQAILSGIGSARDSCAPRNDPSHLPSPRRQRARPGAPTLPVLGETARVRTMNVRPAAPAGRVDMSHPPRNSLNPRARV